MSHHQPHHHKKSHDPQPFPVGAQAAAGEAVVRSPPPAVDRIRARAYEISQARKEGQGDAQADWAQAERELKGPA